MGGDRHEGTHAKGLVGNQGVGVLRSCAGCGDKVFPDVNWAPNITVVTSESLREAFAPTASACETCGSPATKTKVARRFGDLMCMSNCRFDPAQKRLSHSVCTDLTLSVTEVDISEDITAVGSPVDYRLVGVLAIKQCVKGKLENTTYQANLARNKRSTGVTLCNHNTNVASVPCLREAPSVGGWKSCEHSSTAAGIMSRRARPESPPKKPPKIDINKQTDCK